MPSKKKIKAAARKRAAARKPSRAAKKQPQVSYSVIPELGYEDALLKSIVESRGHAIAGEQGVTFAAALSCLTSSLRKVSYNHGTSVGRALFSLCASKKRYAWHIESIADLVSFFERSGYRYVTYNLFPDCIEIMIHKENHFEIGTKIHSFEAGMVAGFISAGMGRMVRVDEVACSNHGSGYCKFSTKINQPNDKNVDIQAISDFVLQKWEPSFEHIRSEYQILEMQPLMRAEYSDALSPLLFHIGNIAGSEMISRNQKSIAKASKMASELGLGAAAYSSSPRKVEVGFFGVRAKKEFVEISIRFLGGMLEAFTKKTWGARVRHSEISGSYKAIMKEME